MASTTLTAQLLSVPEQLVAPVYNTLKGLPLHILFLLFAAFCSFAGLTVSIYIAEPSAQLAIMHRIGQDDDLPSDPPWHG